MLFALRAAAPQPAPAENAHMRTGTELIAAMQAMPYKDVDIEPERPHMPVRSLDDVFAEMRGLADDLDFSRDPSPARPIA